MFDRFFRSDNVLWIAMGKVFDVFVLNTLLLLSILPIITIGPGFTGFYYGMINLVREPQTSPAREFIKSFRRNFKQGVKLGLFLTLLLAFLYTDVRLAYKMGTGIYTLFMVFFAVLFLFALMVSIYAFALLAKFEKTIREILAWAFTLAVKHIGRSFLMVFAIALGFWIMHILPGLLFIVPGLAGMFHAGQIVKVLEQFLPEPGYETDDTADGYGNLEILSGQNTDAAESSDSAGQQTSEKEEM